MLLRGRMVARGVHRLWGCATYQLGDLGNYPASRSLSFLNGKLRSTSNPRHKAISGK